MSRMSNCHGCRQERYRFKARMQQYHTCGKEQQIESPFCKCLRPRIKFGLKAVLCTRCGKKPNRTYSVPRSKGRSDKSLSDIRSQANISQFRMSNLLGIELEEVIRLEKLNDATMLDTYKEVCLNVT